MALPPIVTNSLLSKVLPGTQDKTQKPANKPEAAPKSSAGDIVELSPAALAKIEELKSSSIDTQEKAKKAAGDVRDTLVQNPSLTLTAN